MRVRGRTVFYPAIVAPLGTPAIERARYADDYRERLRQLDCPDRSPAVDGEDDPPERLAP